MLTVVYHSMMTLYNDEHMIHYWRSKVAKIGKNVKIYNSNIDRGHISLLEIGDNVTITNAAILTHDASMYNWVHKSKIAKVRIGSNVFIGYGSIVMPGVTIGNNVIIGANTFVNKDIPDNMVAVGSPIKFLSTTEDHIKRVEEDMKICPVFDIGIKKTEQDVLAMIHAVEEYGRAYDT